MNSFAKNSLVVAAASVALLLAATGQLVDAQFDGADFADFSSQGGPSSAQFDTSAFSADSGASGFGGAGVVPSTHSFQGFQGFQGFDAGSPGSLSASDAGQHQFDTSAFSGGLPDTDNIQFQ